MFKPSKRLGQNFIADKKVLENIIESSQINKNDLILEIGPGQGSLTYALSEKAGKVVAVEKDDRLYNYLLDKLGNRKNIEFINDDILNFVGSKKFMETFSAGDWKVIANIPYYLTSFLLRKILELKNKPSEIILMVQKEVAERMVAGSGEMNLLAVSTQLFAEPSILFSVSKNSFWPKPKVDSMVIKLKVRGGKLDIDEELFFKIVKAGFSSKRKVLANNISDKLGIDKGMVYDIFEGINLDRKIRAQELAISDWVKIYEKIQKRL